MSIADTDREQLERLAGIQRDILVDAAKLLAPSGAILYSTCSIETEENELNRSLERGLADVEAGRVRPIEEIKGMIPGWTSKS